MLRLRLRALILPIAFYSFSALVSGYFFWHAINGQRGLKARDEYSQRVADLETSLAGLQAERARWRHKIDLVRGEEIDRDVLDEQARVELGRVQKSEVVILVPQAKAPDR
jgi:cell division protein FtsB